MNVQCACDGFYLRVRTRSSCKRKTVIIQTFHEFHHWKQMYLIQIVECITLAMQVSPTIEYDVLITQPILQCCVGVAL